MSRELQPDKAVELWGGVECTVNRVGDAYHDQLRLTGHHDRDGVRADQEIGNNRAAILEWPAIHLPLGSGADGSCWREVRLQGANQSIREIRNSIAICVIGIEQLHQLFVLGD